MFKLPIKSNKQNGFTLIEALIALVILSIGISPALILSSNLSATASVAKNNLIAANLAQEGVEVVRSLRDTNWFNGVAYNTGLADGIYRIEWDSDSLIPLGTDPPLKVNNGLYNYSAGQDTIFKRTLTLTSINAADLRIISDITWTERGRIKNIKVESHLFDWK